MAQKAISKAELKTYLSGSGSASRKTPTVPLGVSLRPTGRLMLNVIGSVAQFEREVMLERQREGIRKAKSEGRYKGRAPAARAKSEEIVKLAGEGWTREKIAGELGVGVASVYRVLRERRSPSHAT